MMTGSVLDILIYVFDRYMLEEVPEVPEREHLARDLERAGFAARERRARARLAGRPRLRHERLPDVQREGAPRGVRVFSDGELARLSTECRGFLLTLERRARARLRSSARS